MPSFRYIPILGDKSKCDLKAISIDGLSTKHGDAHSDGGTLYATVVGDGGTVTITMYADALHTLPVLDGMIGTTGGPLMLSPVASSGLSGRAYLSGYNADDTDIVALVSFAADADVMIDQASCQQLGGAAYDATYGLAALHAAAMREIVGSALPAIVPHLYPGNAGLARYFPGQNAGVGPDIPDLRTIANAGQLREAAASLVKARAAEQQEHLEEFAKIAIVARARYAGILEAIGAANVQEYEAADQEQSNVSIGIGSFRRG